MNNTNKPPRFGSNNRFMILQSWLWAEIIHYYTVDLCTKILNKNNDPTGRYYDQMTQAARSVAANIAEGSSRHRTSTKTELSLLDVAAGSLSELVSDLFHHSLRNKIRLWDSNEPNFRGAQQLQVAPARYEGSWTAACQKHLLQHIEAFRQWLGNDSLEVAVNSLMISAERLKLMLQAQMNQLHQEFLKEGGFTEKLSAERLEAKSHQQELTTPRCPICNGPMQKKMAQKGGNHGNPFWSCCQFPQCKGTRPWNYK